MEEIKILEFISSGSGYGYGYGDGYGKGKGDGKGKGKGYGDGDGDGYGDGYGYGKGKGKCYGDGYGKGKGKGYCYGDGYGYGYGDGYGLKSIRGKKIYMVDGIATTISRIHGNTANGTIVNNDLTETPCYIVKEGKYFAHGKTLAEANAALQDKLFDEMSPRSI